MTELATAAYDSKYGPGRAWEQTAIPDRHGSYGDGSSYYGVAYLGGPATQVS